MTVGDIASYYLVKMPELLVLIIPIAFLLALLYALTNHARHHELIAIRAAGISLWRTVLPYLAVGFLFCLGIFYLNEFLAPNSTDNAERILHRRETAAPGALERQWQRNLNFKNDYENRIWNIGAYNTETAEMVKPQVEWRLPDGTRKNILAARAEHSSEGWVFHDVVEVTYVPGQTGTRIDTNRLAMAEFHETPELIRSEIKISGLSNIRAAKKAQLSIREIRNYLRLHRHLPPAESAKLNTQLYGRLAEPWTCLVVVLIALPFGAASGRRNVFVGVASSIFICFSYFVLLKLGLALGTGGYLPPWLAAWFPNLLFGAAGFWMTSRLP
jgi:lipopolysaccharide export system permease protein